MKKLLYLLIFLTVPLSGATYYVSNVGSDAYSGTTTSAPWLTLAKVNSSSFVAGDVICFRKGDTFRGYLTVPSTGSAAAQITFTSYGAGAKPKILGAMDKSTTGSWTNTTGNIWRTASTASPITDAGNIIFNNEASCGVKKGTLVECDSQGEWFYDTTDDRVYMYSAGNPGSFYTHIELGGVYSENVLSIISHSYITLDGLDVRYSANNGIFIQGSNNVIIQNCDVSWIGGMYYGGVSYRMGNGIQMWNGLSNITIRYNYIHDIYDAGISPQGEGTYTQSNIAMYYNVLKYCYYTYEVFTSNPRTLTNVDFNNNTCLYAGTVWSVNQRPDATNARHVRTWGEDGTLSGNDIKNNIFYYATQTGYAFYYNSPFILDYNLYYVTTIGYINTTSYTSLASWRTVTGQESNSVSANPLLNSDWTLQGSSPAINAGTSLGYTRDFAGNSIVGSPDMGAYEYGGATVNYTNLVIEGHSFVAPGALGISYLTTAANYLTYHNTAVGGSEIEDASGRIGTVNGYLISETSTYRNVVLLWLGVNDLSSIVGEGATHYALYKAYVQSLVSAGWKVFCFTITPSDAYGRGAQFEIERNVFNGLMRTDLDLITGVYVLDTDDIPELVDIDNVTYWPTEPGGGALHPSAAAVALATGLFEDALALYWAGEEPTPTPTGTGFVIHNGSFVKSGNEFVKN